MNRYLVILFVVASAFNYSCNSNVEGEIQVVTAEEMQELSEIEDVQLVDDKITKKGNEEFIKNSQNIDYLSPSFEQDIENLDKSKPVIVDCKSGNRSAKCTAKMKDAGFVKISDLDGGIAKWEYKGFEIKSKS